jgi:hypothetical protein
MLVDTVPMVVEGTAHKSHAATVSSVHVKFIVCTVFIEKHV